jgi:hypothetical protein
MVDHNHRLDQLDFLDPDEFLVEIRKLSLILSFLLVDVWCGGGL